jgi:alkylation response protein AidB-like acyl-CoA dehydrogenase
MNLGLSDDQQMLQDTFARFFDDASSMAKVRNAQEAGGFDPALWQGLAELGTFAMRAPETAGGLGMGTIDAVLVMEEAGRTLASGPIAEAILAARLLGQLGGAMLDEVTSGAKVATLAFHDIASQPVQWLPGGAHADLVVARRGGDVVAVSLNPADRKAEDTLASNGIGEVDLGKAAQTVLASGAAATDTFSAALEEWKLLSAAALNGLGREAVRLAAAYACERHAFGVPIGSYQALSHPLANFITELEGGRLFVWKVIHEIARADPGAAAHMPMALWWNARCANMATIQSLRTFGGYGLTTEYDIHLYNLAAKAWMLIHGDPQRLLQQAGRRLYAGESAVLPDVGGVAIDFDLGEDARALAAEVDAFFEATLTPELKAHAHHSWDGHHPLVHRKLAEAGLLFPELPRARR